MIENTDLIVLPLDSSDKLNKNSIDVLSSFHIKQNKKYPKFKDKSIRKSKINCIHLGFLFLYFSALFSLFVFFYYI